MKSALVYTPKGNDPVTFALTPTDGKIIALTVEDGDKVGTATLFPPKDYTYK
jgi:hypothetical protein